MRRVVGKKIKKLRIAMEGEKKDGRIGNTVKTARADGRTGSLSIARGFVGDCQLNIWDKVKGCAGVECKFARLCPYQRSTRPGKRFAPEACLVEQKYLSANLSSMLLLLQKVNDPFIMQWVGMHLIPLYLDLVQLKMEKLLVEDIVYDDNKGQKRVHPIFEEIRRTHREIFAVWRTTGLQRIAAKAGFFKAGGEIIPKADPDMGDGDSYELMMGGAGL